MTSLGDELVKAAQDFTDSVVAAVTKAVGALPADVSMPDDYGEAMLKNPNDAIDAKTDYAQNHMFPNPLTDQLTISDVRRLEDDLFERVTNFTTNDENSEIVQEIQNHVSECIKHLAFWVTRLDAEFDVTGDKGQVFLQCVLEGMD